MSGQSCNICFNCCSIKVHFKDDVPIRITGNDEDPILKGKVCSKSQMSLQSFADPNRLMTPLKRIGERGDGHFTPISWDQALEEISEKLRAVRDEFGPEALAIFAGARSGLHEQRRVDVPSNTVSSSLIWKLRLPAAHRSHRSCVKPEILAISRLEGSLF